MIPFRAIEGGVSGRLEPVEVTMLQSLAAQLFELLDDTPVADDPAVARLLPDAYSDDPDEASEFRRLTERDLRDRKRDNAGHVLAALAGADDSRETTFTLDSAQAIAWLRALADLRLVLASRLGIESEGDEAAGDPLTVDMYHWLAYLQDSLVGALEESLP